MDALPLNLTPAEMAAWLNVTERTLKRWRAMKPPAGPPFLQAAGTVRYPVDLALAWRIEGSAVMAVADDLDGQDPGTAAEPSHQHTTARDGRPRTSAVLVAAGGS